MHLSLYMYHLIYPSNTRLMDIRWVDLDAMIQYTAIGNKIFPRVLYRKILYKYSQFFVVYIFIYIIAVLCMSVHPNIFIYWGYSHHHHN